MIYSLALAWARYCQRRRTPLLEAQLARGRWDGVPLFFGERLALKIIYKRLVRVGVI